MVEAPHPPYTAPEGFWERWRDRPLRLQPKVPCPPDEGLLHDLRHYYAMIENLDHNVGRVMRLLDERGLRGTTAVMFISDHGDLMGSHGLQNKQYPYEESVGVPFIVSFPAAGIGGGRVLRDPTCAEDWFPTLRGLAGLPPDGTKPGIDLTPLLRGEQDRLPRDGVLLEYVAENRPNQAFHEDTWRAVRTATAKYVVLGGEPWLLYDLEQDPYETHNLLGEPSARTLAARLHGLLRERIAATDDDYILYGAFGHPGINVPEWPSDLPRPARKTWT